MFLPLLATLQDQRPLFIGPAASGLHESNPPIAKLDAKDPALLQLLALCSSFDESNELENVVALSLTESSCFLRWATFHSLQLQARIPGSSDK
jgi:hypothetical protein